MGKVLGVDVTVTVGIDDRTPFGSAITPRADVSTRELFGSVGHAGPAVEKRLRQVVDGPAFSLVGERVGPSWRLHEAVLHPEPSESPANRLRVAGLDIVTGPAGWPDLHRLIAALRWGRDLGRLASAADQFDAEGLLVGERPPLATWPGLTFAGHATAVVTTDRARVVIDPFVLSAASAEAGYRPLSWPELGLPDAVLITHSHPDHADLGTLLQLPAETTIVVPEVERETLLAADLTTRLRGLGFTDVRPLRWWSDLTIGDTVVTALPFYGEQPTDSEVLHPEIRNLGNTYRVATPKFTAVFLADSGRDHLGDVWTMASETRRRTGPVDVVFCGYRGWRTYPALHLRSSVARYLLLVPPDLWGTRLELMCDVDGAIDVAERFGARMLVPYADGGAPWYWELGLGPRLDGTAVENVSVDPFPGRLPSAARRRVQHRDGSWLASPVEVVVLRPNDHLDPILGTVTRPTNGWPYGDL